MPPGFGLLARNGTSQAAVMISSPLALAHPVHARKSGSGLPQSKTLSGRATARREFMVPMHAESERGLCMNQRKRLDKFVLHMQHGIVLFARFPGVPEFWRKWQNPPLPLPLLHPMEERECRVPAASGSGHRALCARSAFEINRWLPFSGNQPTPDPPRKGANSRPPCESSPPGRG